MNFALKALDPLVRFCIQKLNKNVKLIYSFFMTWTAGFLIIFLGLANFAE